MKIVDAKKTDAEILTRLTIRSKSHWNYSEQQIEAWTEDLTIDPTYIATNYVRKCIFVNKLLGYYSYFKIDNSTIKLDNLFVDPEHIGKGCGKFMLISLIQEIKEKGFTKITLDADPNATNFYLKYGFKIVGQLETDIADRFLPVMEMILPVK